MKIVLNGIGENHSRNEGYKVAEDNIFSYLKNKNIDIKYRSLMPANFLDLYNSGIGIQYESDSETTIDEDILINHRLPLDYSVSNKYNIGFTYWETTELPSSWVSRMNQMNEIWTTSLWARNVFIESGVTVPVYNFRLGVDKLFYPKKRIVNDSKFTFLCIGSPSTRKNSQMTVDAFIKVFSGDDRIRLLYKSIDSPDARWYRNGQMSRISDHPQIDVIEDDVPIEELSNIYDASDCVVYPTSGEGWGMLPYQGIAKGIPTICTNATGCTEYAELSVPLNFTMGKNKMPGIYSNSGSWAEPDFDDLCAKMLYVYNNYDVVSDYTYNNAVLNEQTMSWDSAAEGYYERLCQISKELKTKL